jgi:hypothetical protein
MNRGNETASHLAMKRDAANVLRRRGWVVRFEAKNTDVAGFKPGMGQIWAVECERSPKWVLKNIMKDMSHGAHGVVIVASTGIVAAAAQQRIDQQPAAIRVHARVVIMEQFTEEYVEKNMERKN